MATYNPLQLLPLPPSRVDPKPVASTITVDPFSDLIWVGTSKGNVAAYCDPLQVAANVRFPAHGSSSGTNGVIPGFNAGVREIQVTDREVWTLTEGGVGGRKKGGQPRWSITDPMRGMRSMSANPTNSHELLVGGTGQTMLVNTSRGDIVRKFDSLPTVRLAPLPRTVLSALSSGSISILDPRTGFKSASFFQAHTGGISGADANGHLVCTWGWTHKQGRPLPDPLVRLFDIRTLRPLPPITFPPTPSFALLLPTNPSSLIVASQTGTMQVVDLNGNNSAYIQLDIGSYATSMALSPLGDYLAFGDAEGQLHLWTTHDTEDMSLKPFNGYDGVKPDWPDQSELPITHIDEYTPLNLIGMPHYAEPLLSNIPLADYAPVTSPFFNPPEPVPQQVLSTMKVSDMIGYASMPKDLKGKRYVRTARTGAGKYATGKGWTISRRESGPRFRSEKERQRQPSIGGVEEETTPGEIPKYCRKVEIKYSKFGIEDFDFGYYNRTEYSGLETDILNSYTNSLLQALHYSPPIRAVAKAHICVDCKKEHCLLCEAGFLFRMLEDAKGTNCQASNFSRAFTATPQATALGLMDDDKSPAPYGSLIQSFNRWLLSTFSTEAVVGGDTFAVRKPTLGELSLGSKESAIDQVLGIRTRTTNTCSACDNVTSREGSLHVIDLQYARKPAAIPFTELLRTSLLRETTTKATCSNCKQFVPLASRRIIDGEMSDSLPPILSVNAMVSNPEIFELWQDRPAKGQIESRRYLPRRVTVASDADGLIFSEDGEGVIYDVTSLVVQIQETPDSHAHLISYVKMPPSEEGEGGWVLLNDFAVRHVSEDEVFSFAAQWKIPAIIMLSRRDNHELLRLDTLPTQADTCVLFEDVSMAWNRRPNMIKHKPLTPEELPRQGTLIAIDAEFVALQQEEMEFRSDGTKSILRPSHMSLARVSVIRGEGDKEEVPFIDDYILTKEVVVDFLTEFSGIKHGDLDANNSPHTLVPLKVAYKKLRLLVDLGCIFIGHGLAKDFRTINLFVPPEQILDTVKIYTSPSRQRRLSLRFLAWFLLHTEIQTASHDSIEDAKYALMLYRAYLGYEEEGRFEEIMEQIFEEGQRVGFRPPQENRAPSPALVAAQPNPPAPPPQPRGQRHLAPPGGQAAISDNWRTGGQVQGPQPRPANGTSTGGRPSRGQNRRRH